jgi:hypothetical protein
MVTKPGNQKYTAEEMIRTLFTCKQTSLSLNTLSPCFWNIWATEISPTACSTQVSLENQQEFTNLCKTRMIEVQSAYLVKSIFFMMPGKPNANNLYWQFTK